MSKRFTDTEKWKDPWFRSLPPWGKLLWLYICDECDNGGIWKVDIDLASFQIGIQINKEEAIRILNSDRPGEKPRVMEIDDGKYWIATGLYEFQWGSSKDNSVLVGVRKKLSEHKFSEELFPFIPSIGCSKAKKKVHQEKSHKIDNSTKPEAEKAQTPTQDVVEYYKRSIGADKIPGWDKGNFSRFSKHASNLLSMLGSVQEVKNAIDWINHEATGKYSWHLGTLEKNIHLYKNNGADGQPMSDKVRKAIELADKARKGK